MITLLSLASLAIALHAHVRVTRLRRSLRAADRLDIAIQQRRAA